MLFHPPPPRPPLPPPGRNQPTPPPPPPPPALDAKLAHVQALREAVDAGRTAEWHAAFVPAAVPALVALLAATPPSLVADSPAHRLRGAILDLFAR